MAQPQPQYAFPVPQQPQPQMPQYGMVPAQPLPVPGGSSPLMPTMPAMPMQPQMPQQPGQWQAMPPQQQGGPQLGQFAAQPPQQPYISPDLAQEEQPQLKDNPLGFLESKTGSLLTTLRRVTGYDKIVEKLMR